MKFIVLVICLSLFAQSMAGDCNNPLLKKDYNPNAPTDVLTTPAKATGLSFCKNLEGADSCCSKDTIEKLKT